MSDRVGRRESVPHDWSLRKLTLRKSTQRQLQLVTGIS